MPEKDNYSAAINTQAVSYRVNDKQLTGLAYGDNSADIVLCLHGWLDNAASFLPLFEQLQYQKKQRTTDGSSVLNKCFIAIDWPGHGLSEHRSHDAHYHFFDYVYDLLQLIEINQWSRVELIGHSMGGMIASAFAAAFPEKVKSLTLVDSLGFITAEAKQTSEQLRKGLLSRVKVATAKAQPTKAKAVRLFSLDTAIKARLNVSDLNYPQAKLLIERALLAKDTGQAQQQEVQYSWRSDARLRTVSPYRLTLEQAQQLMSEISCPVQLIYGDKGMDAVVVGLKQFAPLLQNITVSRLDGGHHVHMEQPKDVAKLIANFWQLNKQIK